MYKSFGQLAHATHQLLVVGHFQESNPPKTFTWKYIYGLFSGQSYYKYILFKFRVLSLLEESSNETFLDLKSLFEWMIASGLFSFSKLLDLIDHCNFRA